MNNFQSDTNHYDRMSKYYETLHMNQYQYGDISKSGIVSSRSNPSLSGVNSSVLENEDHVSIPSFSIEKDADGTFTLYHLVLKLNGLSWEISRRYKNFIVLHQELQSKISIEELPALPKQKNRELSLEPEFINERRIELEIYINKLLSIPEVWECTKFLEFIDGPPHYLQTQITMSRFKDEIISLKRLNAYFSQQLHDSNSYLLGVIKDLNNRLQNLEAKSEGCTLQSGANSEKDALEIKGSTNKLASDMVYSAGPTGFSHPWGGLDLLNSDKDEEDTSCSENRRSSLTSLYSIEEQNPFIIQDSADLATEIVNDISTSASPQPRLSIGPKSPRRTPSMVKSAILGSFLQENVYFPIDSVPLYDSQSYIDYVIERTINFIIPQDSDVRHRISIERYVFQLVRSCLGAQVYENGLHAIKCFLPDDELTLSIYICKGLESCWYTRLNEKLSRIVSGNDDQLKPLDMDNNERNSDPHCTITNVSCKMENGQFKLQLSIGDISIDIRPNVKLDLCFGAFLEETDRIIGRSHLFKRTLMMLRAWWQLEAPTYFSSSQFNHSIISHSCLCTLVIAIFQKYHFRIFYPFQAFCLFFAEYANFDWGSNAISIVGPIRSQCLPIDVPTYSRLFQNDGIISPVMISQYQDLARNSSSNASSPGKASGHSRSITMPPTHYSSLSKVFGNIEDSTNIDGESNDHDPHSPSTSFVKQFGLMCILHPLDPSINLMSPSLSQSNFGTLMNILQRGALRALEIAQSVQEPTDDKRRIDELVFGTLFKETFLKYGQFKRAENAAKSDIRHPIESTSQRITLSSLDEQAHQNYSFEGMMIPLDDSVTTDCLTVSLDKFWEQIRYSSTVSDSLVTEAVLRTLSKDILNERGPLPVGEIGKMLQEITGLSTLSVYLKDKFGGLKKFLEKLPDDFVITNDHPFNPHVFLIQNLSRKDLTVINQGGLPSHLIIAATKKKNMKKKRNPSEPAMHFAHSNYTTQNRTLTPPTVINPIGSLAPSLFSSKQSVAGMLTSLSHNTLPPTGGMVRGGTKEISMTTNGVSVIPSLSESFRLRGPKQVQSSTSSGFSDFDSSSISGSFISSGTNSTYWVDNNSLKQQNSHQSTYHNGNSDLDPRAPPFYYY